MLTFTPSDDCCWRSRRLLFISLIIFLLLDLAPGDPIADQPLTIPPEVRQKMREALGLDSPAYVRYLLAGQNSSSGSSRWC
jgi:ABC-type dipeptide/oligopeptide/nickel transport system permease component